MSTALSDPATERSVLGCAILDKDALYRIMPLLSAEDFSLDAHRRIYRAILELANAGEPVDDITVCKTLTAAGQLEAVGGMAAVSDLGTNVAFGMARVANVEKYAETILDKACRRKMQAVAQALQAAVEDARTPTEDCMRMVQESLLAIEATDGGKVARKTWDIMPELMDELKRQSKCEGLVGFTTGVRSLDDMTGGIRPGELWAVGALPGRGKTALGVQMSVANAKAGIPVMFVSIEMSAIELSKRLLAANSNFSAALIRNPRYIADDRWPELGEDSTKVGKLPIFVDDRGSLKIDQMLESASLLIRRHQVALIVVDYLQIVEAPGRDIKDQVSYTAKALRAFAKSENVAVVQLSQLSRPKGKDINARPTMIDLKESGAIEETSHVVLLPYMPLDDAGKFVQDQQELIVGKSRNGSVGSLPVVFDTKRLQFGERV
jgi:replicative DNA helicase